jgi:hypothetical protein
MESILKKDRNREYAGVFPILLLALAMLSSVFYYKIILLNNNMIYALQMAVVALMLVSLLFQQVFWKFRLTRHHFTIPILLIMLGVFTGMLSAYAFHDQDLQISLWSQRFMYFYVFYFFLHILKIPVEQIEKLVFVFAFIYVGGYLLQYAVYPTELFDVRIDPSRGTLRIFLPGLSFLFLAYFISLQKVFYQNSLTYALLMLLFLSIIILGGGRQLLAKISLVSLLALLFSKKVKSRYLLFLVAALAALSLFILFQEIFRNLLDISKEQMISSNKITRLKTTEFFLTDFFPNGISYAMGNGEAHQWSSYGMEIYSYKVYHGYYLSDIGFIGEYTKYGIFLVIGGLMMMIKALRHRHPKHHLYIRLYLISTLISLPMGNVFSQPYSISVICLLLYIIDLQKAKESETRKPWRPVVYFPSLEDKKAGFSVKSNA